MGRGADNKQTNKKIATTQVNLIIIMLRERSTTKVKYAIRFHLQKVLENTD